jgi:hypothetical protein
VCVCLPSAHLSGPTRRAYFTTCFCIPPIVHCRIAGQYARALLLALHLNDTPLVRRVVDDTPLAAVRLVAAAVPTTFLARLIEIIAASLLPDSAATPATPHLEFALTWVLALLEANGKPMRAHPRLFAAGLRSVQRALLHHRDTLGKLYVVWGGGVKCLVLSSTSTHPPLPNPSTVA